MALTAREIQDAYVTFFNRAADTEGFAYWTSYTGSISDLYATFAQQTEYTSVYGGKTAEQQITTVYQNLFNRAPDAEGLAYWKPLVEAGTITLANLALTVNRGAQGTDITALTGKIDAAIVTTDAAIAANLPGQTFTLTSGADKGAAFTGTDKADTFNGSLTTVGAGDELDGAGGVDTLNIEINAAVTSKFTTTGIENVNITSYGAQAVDTKGMSGVEKIATVGSTGGITLNNLASANTTLGFAGASTNSITANYTAGVLSGTGDTLGVELNAAKAVALVAGAGFEGLKITATGANDITTLTVPGISTITIGGTGSVNVKDQLTGVSTLNAVGMSGALTSGTASTTTGIVDQTITAASTGATLLLGSGADNIGFANTNAATAGSTIKAGAGNDIVQINAAGAGAVVVFGEGGDDTIGSVTSALASTDVLDGGDGTDTVRLDGSVANNAMVLRSVENVIITAGTATQTFTNDDSASAITFQAANNSVVDLAGLKAGSTVTVNKATGFGTSDAVAGVKVGFTATEAASTINVNAAMDDVITTSKITAATFNFAEAVGSTNGTITTTAATSLTLNATKALARTTVEASDDKLTSVSVTGGDTVTLTNIGAANSNALASVAVSAAKAVSLGTIGADSTKLASVTVSNTTGTTGVGAIGSTTNAEVLTASVTSAGAVTGSGIDSTKLGDVTFTSTGSTVATGAIGLSATQIGNITVSSKGDATLLLIGNGTAAATEVGTISVTSTDGNVKLADTNSIDVKDAAGLTVNLTAKSNIGGTTTPGTTAAVITNEGAINASLAGTAKAVVNYTVATKAAGVNLTASNTGGLVSTITNNGTADDGTTSTISLGNAKTGTTNALTVTGTADVLNITGGTGIDSVVLAAAENLKTGTVALGTGADVLSFLGTGTVGVAINLGSSTVTFSDTGSTTVAAGKAVGYDSSSASAKVVTGATAFDLTVSGISEVVGTGQVDYIVANNEGTTIKGGALADEVILGAGADTVILADLADNATVSGDVIRNFTVANDIIKVLDADTALDKGTTDGAIVLATGATYDAAFAADNNATVMTLSGNVATHTFTTYLAGTSTLAELEAAIATAISTATAANTAATDIILVAIDDGTNTGIVKVDGVSTTAAFAAGDISVVGIVVGLADATTLTAANFAIA